MGAHAVAQKVRRGFLQCSRVDERLLRQCCRVLLAGFACGDARRFVAPMSGNFGGRPPGWRCPGAMRHQDAVSTTLEPLEATFNFILDSQHTMTIGGIECCTLGHGIVNDDSDVRSSQYWGADVVKDLACMPGFDEGYVNIVAPKTARNVDTQTVSR